MNRKGFTLVELVATLVLLGIVLGITIVGVNGGFSSAKEKSEDVFVGTIKDAMEIYLTSSNAKLLLAGGAKCSDTLDKSYGKVNVYRVTTTFNRVIDSEYKPITQADLVNPANKEDCKDAKNIAINIYRDDDYVYYYSINKSNFGCLIKDGVISNLPEGFVC